jgi:hypothetical protein
MGIVKTVEVVEAVEIVRKVDVLGLAHSSWPIGQSEN